ncbi:unnamed protein product [Urochloa humidicola]
MVSAKTKNANSTNFIEYRKWKNVITRAAVWTEKETAFTLFSSTMVTLFTADT